MNRRNRYCGNCGNIMALIAYDTPNNKYIFECKICGMKVKERTTPNQGDIL